MKIQTDSTRFLEAARQILSVSKTEILKREAAYKEAARSSQEG
jgi:hypothetical protein